MTEQRDDQARSLEGYRGYLTRLAQLQMGSHLQGKFDAVDVVQQTLLRAHERRQQFQGETVNEWVAWLRAILANQMAEEVRKFSRLQRDVTLERSLEAALEQSSARMEAMLAADQSSPSQRAIRKENLLLLENALAKLPNDQRQVLELRYLQSCSVDEISRRLNRSEASVTGLLRRGLKKLRGLLNK